MSKSIWWLAAKAQSDPAFVAHALEIHRTAHGLTWEQHADRLGVSPETLCLIALCKMPRPGDAGLDDLLEIWERYRCNPRVLRQILGR